MVQVCDGIRTKPQMLEQALEQYRDVFIRARNNFAQVVEVRSAAAICHLPEVRRYLKYPNLRLLVRMFVAPVMVSKMLEALAMVVMVVVGPVEVVVGVHPAEGVVAGPGAELPVVARRLVEGEAPAMGPALAGQRMLFPILTILMEDGLLRLQVVGQAEVLLEVTRHQLGR